MPTTYIETLYFIKDLEERYIQARKLVFKLTPGTEDYNEVIGIVQRAWKALHSRNESVDTFSSQRNELSSSGYRG